jgi:hypothetical protein
MVFYAGCLYIHGAGSLLLVLHEVHDAGMMNPNAEPSSYFKEMYDSTVYISG